MHGKCFLAENVPQVGQEPVPSTPPEPVRKSRKKLYVLIGVVAVAAVLLATVFMLWVPQGLGETIPYGYDYTVGERFTYNTSIAMDAAGQHVAETGNMNMHIVGFDGDNYTIDEAVHYVVQGVSQDYSFTIIMSKAGQLVGGSNIPSSMQSMYSMIQDTPGFGLVLNRTTVRVGETVQVPFNVGNSSFSFTGTYNYKVTNIENVTVPAGTYKTFKIEVSTTNLHGTSQGVDVSASITGQLHMEYGTCHLVDLSMQEAMTGAGTTVSMTMSMTLIGDTTG
jgi:hypothetical protein